AGALVWRWCGSVWGGRGIRESKVFFFCFSKSAQRLHPPPMFDRRYFVYMLQSTSRRTLYIGFTDFLIGRVIEHRIQKHSNSFSAKYRTWRLVYYEEYGDSTRRLTVNAS